MEELRLGDVLVAVDPAVAQPHDLVAGAQSRLGRRAVDLHGDRGRRVGLAGDEEDGGQHDEGEDQVGERPAQHDGGTGIERLAEEGAACCCSGVSGSPDGVALVASLSPRNFT